MIVLPKKNGEELSAAEDYSRIVDQAASFIFWMLIFGLVLRFGVPSAQAADETVVASVVSSVPYYGKNQTYSKQCLEGTNRCWLVGDMPKYYATTFTNGRVQFLILTVAQFPHDVWFDVVRNCDTGKCVYKSAIMSEYQSPETLAIDEILAREQNRYLQNPKRMY